MTIKEKHLKFDWSSDDSVAATATYGRVMASRSIAESVEIKLRKKLVFHGSGFLIQIMEMIGTLPHLKTFRFIDFSRSLSKCRSVSSECASVALLHTRSLKVLDIQYLQDGYVLGDLLATSLTGNPSLERVQIGTCKISGFPGFVAALATLPSLKNLRLCEINYNVSDTLGLCTAFTELCMSHSLETLEIESHCLDGVDVIAMARGIERNAASALRELCLTYPRMKASEQVVIALAYMLLFNTTLVKLKFVAPLDDTELMPIIEALRYNRTLRVLCTNHYNGFTDSKFDTGNSGDTDDGVLDGLQVEAAAADEADAEEVSRGIVEGDEESGDGGDDGADRVDQKEHELSEVQADIIDILEHNDVLEQLQSDVECVPAMSCYLNLNAAKRTFLLGNPLLHDAWLHTIIRFRRDPNVSFFLFSNNPGLISAIVL